MLRQRKLESFRIFQGIQTLSHCRPILPLSITPGNTESQRFRDVFIGYRKETVAWNGLWPETCNFIKKETLHRCFPVNFAKFLRIPFLQNTSRRVLLWHCYDCSTVRASRYKFYELLPLLHSEIHCWRITTCTRNMTNDPINIIGLFRLLTLLVVSIYL